MVFSTVQVEGEGLGVEGVSVGEWTRGLRLKGMAEIGCQKCKGL